MAPALKAHGVQDPDAEWGEYALLRRWDENAFLTSLRAAESTPHEKLKRDGNRAVMLCSTTDAYQVFRHPDPVVAKEINRNALDMVARSLELVRDHSTLNVRLLTRSPLARLHFSLMRSFGNRFLFGMSLPTLRNDLARVYEPAAPAPSQRLATLQAAREAGLNVFVAMAPTYPECDAEDLKRTLTEIAKLDPVTVFHEPINMRAENVSRIAAHAASLGVPIKTDVFHEREAWQTYAVSALRSVEAIASEVGLGHCLHLWPDKALGSQIATSHISKSFQGDYPAWLKSRWERISEWPSAA